MKFIINFCLTTLVLLLFLNSNIKAEFAFNRNLPDSTNISNANVSSDSLYDYTQKANNLWNKKQSDLDLAVELLSRTAEKGDHSFYKLAVNFYFWSIQNASFESEKDVIQEEMERLLPLQHDSTKQNWKEYFKEEDPHLLREITGFWKLSDPYSATQLNERLIEHWERIIYAQENFDRADKPPYNTDDRGILYVRLGPPDKITQKEVRFSYIHDPLTGERLDFELGSLIDLEVEIWEYNNEDGENYFFLFGSKNGWGEYGLRKNLLELVGFQPDVTFQNSYWMSYSKIRRLSESALQYGLYQKLAPYHPFFERMYNTIESRLTRNYDQDVNTRFMQSAFDVEFRTYHQLTRQLKVAPANKTTMKTTDENLAAFTKTYRFLNDNNETEYIIAIQPDLSELEKESFESQFLSNKLYLYDENWNTVTQMDDLTGIAESNMNMASLYQIDDQPGGSRVYFSSEVIDTTYNNITLPGKINPKTSAIIKSTNKKKIDYTEPLDKNRDLLISDLIIGKSQNPNSEARVPVTPSLDMIFDKDSEIMIFFEAYNIPAEGYSFTYFFKEKNKLLKALPLGMKKVDDKPEVTILADEAKERDQQFFTIDLNGLEPGNYRLVLQFNSFKASSQNIAFEKEVELSITD